MLSAGELLDEAKTSSGLNDYGDMGFAEGLGVLVKSINDESRLTPPNDALYKMELLRMLENRLRMQVDLKRHPEILDEEILPPVFITSLPRTGSTKLHRLLAATGAFNSMNYWQAYYFAPFTSSENIKPDPRIAAAEAHLQWIYRRAPEFQAMHPMYAEETEEELGLLDAGFNSLYQHAVFVDVPSYIQWVFSRDGAQVFSDLRRMLQYLQWQHHRSQKRRWILKTPSMFGREADMAKAFPGTDFIVTHRQPLQIMASAFALYRGVRRQYGDEDLTAVAGETMMFNFTEAQKGHLHWRSGYPANKVMDVRFTDIVGNDVAVVKTIFAFFGLSFTPTHEANLRAWIEMDEQRKHFRSTQTLDEFSITPAQIEQRLAPYIQRYAEFL